MGSVRLVRRRDMTPEQARDARARALRFVFECAARKKGGVSGTAPNDGKGIDKHAPAKKSIPDE